MKFLKKIAPTLRPIVDRFPRVARLYRVIRDQLTIMEDPIVTPWGFKLVGNTSMGKGTFEIEETKLVREVLNEVDTFINVGANIGYYCCHALDMGKQVIAFEPMPKNLHYLCKNIKLNNWKNVEVFPLALSNTIDILEIYGDNTGASLHKGWAGIPDNWVTLVPVSTYDRLIGRRLEGEKTLVLIDVEGAEQWMLEGAKDLISLSPSPVWVIEIIISEQQPEGVTINPKLKQTFAIFFDQGYEAYNIDKGLNKVTRQDIDLVVSRRKTFKTSNFLFRKV